MGLVGASGGAVVLMARVEQCFQRLAQGVFGVGRCPLGRGGKLLRVRAIKSPIQMPVTDLVAMVLGDSGDPGYPVIPPNEVLHCVTQ